MGVLKDQINKIRSPHLRKVLKPIYLNILKLYKGIEKIPQIFIILKVKQNHKKVLKSLKRKRNEPLKVAFLVIDPSIWKYDLLFKKMIKDDMFNPVIFACPRKDVGENEQKEIFENVKSQFGKRNYPVLMPYNDTGSFINLNKIFKPEIVFFTLPHDLSYKDFSIKSYKNTLTCYYPYSIMATNKPYLQYDKLFHNLLWRFYNETPLHDNMCKKYSRVKGKNSKIVGSSIFETLKAVKNSSNVWNTSNKNQKKIIYAPHHTFNDLEEMNFSTIIENGYFILNLAKKYKNEICVAFKPHPHLKSKLYKYNNWGKTKTDLFFSEWEKLQNTQLEEGDYINLFNQSDAMIMDSISFMTEYLFTKKPALFLLKNKTQKKYFNDYGKEVLKCLDIAYSHKEIEDFVLNVIEGQNINAEAKENFIKNNFNFSHEEFSDFVIKDLKESIFKS